MRNQGEPQSQYRSFPVTENLYDALKRLSQAHAGEWLWIDAISINQSDIGERSTQVAMMKEIYNNAAHVVIWLGELATLHRALSVMTWIANQLMSDTGCQSNNIIGPGGLTLTTEHIDSLRIYTWDDVADMSAFEAYAELVHLFSLPWFRRVWVLQEAFSHTAVTVRVGEVTLPWGSIILAALWQSFLTRDYLSKSRRDIDDKDMSYLPELWLGLLHNRVPRGLSMIELVCSARDFQASDPRDKVFALLGIANDLEPEMPQLTELLSHPDAVISSKQPEPFLAPPTSNGSAHAVSSGHILRPDYTQTTEEVYLGLARFLISRSGNLDILSAIDTFTEASQYTKPVSWMPNLDVSIATIRGLGFPRKYNASFSTELRQHKAISNAPGPTILSLSGFVLDTVSPQISPLLTLGHDLCVYIGDNPTAVSILWRSFLPPAASEATLLSYIHTITATGFGLSNEFPEHPLGKVVPPQAVPTLIADFAAFWSCTDPHLTSLPNPADLKRRSYRGRADQFAVLVGKACHERRFFLTADGRMGLCPRGAMEGDSIVVLYGGSVPYVLRK